MLLQYALSTHGRFRAYRKSDHEMEHASRHVYPGIDGNHKGSRVGFEFSKGGFPRFADLDV
jgi:hypothetical protein